jgi:hypothetical protein
MGLVAALAMGGAACNGGGTTDTGPADTGPADSGAPCDDSGLVPMPGVDAGACYRAQPCDMNPFCPNVVTNDPMHPQFLIQQIDVSQPASLTSPALRHILNGALVSGSFGWGIKLDLTTNMITTGSLQPGVMPQNGTGLFNSTFSFINGTASDAGAANRWDPVMSSVTLMGDTFSTGMISLITTPVYDSANPGSVLTELPLRDARMHDVVMTSMRNCIGQALGNHPFSSCVDGRWITSGNPDGGMGTPSGVLEANITIADAMNVQITQLSTTLCNLLAGSMCDSTPQAMWMHPPDSMSGTTTMNNAWHLVAYFAAVSTHIN